MQLTRAIQERCFSITCRRWNSRPYQLAPTLFGPSPALAPLPRLVYACVCTFCFYVSLYVCTFLAVVSVHTFTSSSHHLLIQHLAFCFLFFLSFLAVLHLVACIYTTANTPYSSIHFGTKKKSSSTRPIKVENYITSYSLFISGIKRFTIYLCFHPFLLFFVVLPCHCFHLEGV